MEIENGSTIDKKNLSEDIELSMSDLELLANKKKVQSLQQEVPVEDILSKDSEASKRSKRSKRSDSERSERRKPSEKKTRKHVSTTSTDSSSSMDTHDYQKEKQKKIQRENKDDTIRREKSTYLYKIDLMNQKKNISRVKLDMNCTLEEIKNEFERVRTTIENEKMVKFCKQMLLMGVQGVEMLNNRFDPLGVDLDGWSEAMGYSMENQEYDEVLSELYEKYKGRGQMSPELKLVLMIVGSAAMFTITKRLAKNTAGTDMLSSLLGNFMNKGPSGPEVSSSGMNQQNSQQEQIQKLQQELQQQQIREQQQHIEQLRQQLQQSTQMNQQSGAIPHFMTGIPGVSGLVNQSAYRIPTLSELNDNNSDSSSDMQPSKIKGPNNRFDTPDSIDLQNIIKTMNDRKKQKQEISIASEIEDTIEEKQIKPAIKRGRPAKKRQTRGVAA